MKNKNNKGIVVVNGKEKWERREAMNATKLIFQMVRKCLKNKMVKRRNLDVFGNSNVEIARKQVNEMIDDVLISLSQIKLPKKYMNKKIYKECLEAYKSGLKKNM